MNTNNIILNELTNQKIQIMVERALNGHQVELDSLSAEERQLFNQLKNNTGNAIFTGGRSGAPITGFSSANMF
jgi:hypothetical protein